MINLVAFAGSHETFGLAEYRARIQANAWIDHVRLSARNICQMTTQVLQTTTNDKSEFIHLVTLMVDTDGPVDWEIVQRVQKKFKEAPLPNEPQSDPKPRIKRTEKAMRSNIDGNNIRAARMGALGELNYEGWSLLCDHFGNICLKCKADVDLTIDHVIPMPEGANSIENIQPLCHGCNSSKRRKDTDYRDPALLAAFLELIKIV